jgi:hypothetical protein
MRIIIDASPEEYAALIRDLSEGNDLSKKVAALFSVIKTEEKTNKPLPVGNMWDDFTWPAIHLFDIIRVHHTEKTEDYFSLSMTELVKNHYRNFGIKPVQISRIVGGARQTTNKYSQQPLLQLHKVGNDKIVRASKRFLDGFYELMKNWLSQYIQKLEQRGSSLPGDMRSYKSPTKK